MIITITTTKTLIKIERKMRSLLRSISASKIRIKIKIVVVAEVSGSDPLSTQQDSNSVFSFEYQVFLFFLLKNIQNLIHLKIGL